MNFPKMRAILFFGAIVAVNIAGANPLNVTPDQAKKLARPEVAETAGRGVSQDLIVQIDADSVLKPLDAQRAAELHELDLARVSTTLAEADRNALMERHARADANLVVTLKSQLKALKDAYFPDGQLSSAKVVQDFDTLDAIILRVPDKASLEAVLRSPGVKYVEPNYRATTTAAWPTQYSDLSIINVPTAVNRNITGKNTRVAIIDTAANIEDLPNWDVTQHGGCEYEWQRVNADGTYALGTNGYYVALPNCRTWNVLNFTEADAYTNSLYYCDSTGTGLGVCNEKVQHGTLVAQIIARVAPNAWLSPMQVFNRDGSGNASAILNALNWIGAHAGTLPRIVAVNLSIAIDPTTKYTSACTSGEFPSALASLKSKGILPVVASGNNGWKDGVVMPACVPGILSVGATTDSLTGASNYLTAPCSDPQLAADSVPCFSNNHPTLVNVLAPGVNIGDSRDYTGMQSGTSFAAPHVAGAVALLRGDGAYPYMSADQTISQITSTGTPVQDRLKATIVRPRIDIAKALPAQTLKTVTLASSSVTLGLGDTTTVGLHCADQNGTSMYCPFWTWTSSTPNVATVTQMTVSSITITGKMVGAATFVSNGGAMVPSINVIVDSKAPPPVNPCLTQPQLCR